MKAAAEDHAPKKARTVLQSSFVMHKELRISCCFRLQRHHLDFPTPQVISKHPCLLCKSRQRARLSVVCCLQDLSTPSLLSVQHSRPSLTGLYLAVCTLPLPGQPAHRSLNPKGCNSPTVWLEVVFLPLYPLVRHFSVFSALHLALLPSPSLPPSLPASLPLPLLLPSFSPPPLLNQ